VQMSGSGYPRKPHMSARPFRTATSGLAEESESVKDQVKVTTEHKVEVKEKDSYETKSENEHDRHDDKHHKKHKKHDSGFSGAWLLWIVVIFIIILLIVFGAFWFAKPGCVTKQSDASNTDGEEAACGEVDICRAFLYAFFITFFIVLILGAMAWACGSY